LFTVEKGYHLNQSEKIIRHLITEIMCNEYVSFEETATRFGTFKDYVKKVVNFRRESFAEFVQDGLLLMEDDNIFRVTATGRFFIRNIAARFDPGLEQSTKQFSKAL
jgi:oxygen-independent coproporphyrinogen III oxidase